MTIKLYYLKGSPGVRAVLVTAKALGLTLDLHTVDFLNNEQLSPEYLKLNPQHTVPTLDDNGYVLWDSHAIITYLVEKYGKDDLLYPKDVLKRAIINQRLHFDSGVLFSILRTIDYAYIKGEITTLPSKFKNEVIEAYEFLEKFLEGHQWVVGDHITVADFSLAPTVMCLDYHVKVDEAHPNVLNWLKRVKEHPWFEDDAKEMEGFCLIFDQFKLKK